MQHGVQQYGELRSTDSQDSGRRISSPVEDILRPESCESVERASPFFRTPCYESVSQVFEKNDTVSNKQNFPRLPPQRLHIAGFLGKKPAIPGILKTRQEKNRYFIAGFFLPGFPRFLRPEQNPAKNGIYLPGFLPGFLLGFCLVRQPGFPIVRSATHKNQQNRQAGIQLKPMQKN